MSVVFKEYIGFISNDECEYVINLAKSKEMTLSTVLSKIDNYRTSYLTSIKYGEDRIIDKVCDKIASETNLKPENVELQINRYYKGEYFKVHGDYLPIGSKEYDRGGQRLYSFLIYLNKVEEGGETYFPMFDFKITPVKGNALSWNNCIIGTVDYQPESAHEGLPVINGEKWIIVAWIRESKFI